MSNLTIAWILLTPLMVGIFSGAIINNAKAQKEDALEGAVILAIVGIVSLAWWGLYFLIK